MKGEITLTIGIFFDGTGNNATNTESTLKAGNIGYHDLNFSAAGTVLAQCAQSSFGFTGASATSYIGYYTNIHWLRALYREEFTGGPDVQRAIYIDGIGTEDGQPDSILGQALGIMDTGVVAKTDKAVSELAGYIQGAINMLRKNQPGQEIVVKTLQFDIFGFSRGAAAARHFANRIQSQDALILRAIRQGMSGAVFRGRAGGKTRFIGLFDTVAAIATPGNGLNPNNANTGGVSLVLRPGVADAVFHIAAAHECRFNFALNSVKPAWPELMLPGTHSDIGGGYLPVTAEALFLTRPKTETVPSSQPDVQTRVYQNAVAQMRTLEASPCAAPLVRVNNISAETWHDERLPVDRYGQMQKRSYAALTMRRQSIRNDWSRVALRVMLEAAQEAGVVFDDVNTLGPETRLPDELISFCARAVAMGKVVRAGALPPVFSAEELDVITAKYIHCSASWNTIVTDASGGIVGGASPSDLIGFINRPDEQWRRTVYDMDGRKV